MYENGIMAVLCNEYGWDSESALVFARRIESVVKSSEKLKEVPYSG